jgi:endonuclease/exonuclease/phosphatase (EEP) superfamily protein YafD
MSSDVRKQQGKVSLNGLLQAAAVLTALFSIVSVFDTGFQLVELFTHFRLQYLVVAVLLAVVFLWYRDRNFTVLLILVSILNASFIVPWYRDNPEAAAGPQIKLLHANVHSSNTDYQRLIDLVASEQPDIIFLQEVTPEWEAGVASLSKQYPYAYVESREGNFGIALYSKLPFDSAAHVSSPPLNHPTIIASVLLGGERLTLISTHPTIPIGHSYYARNEQLESVTQLARRVSGPVAVIGDLNETIWGPRYARLEQLAGLRNARRGFGILPTWPTFMPLAMIPIDHVLVSVELKVLETHTGKRFGSDHLPLLVTLAL